MPPPVNSDSEDDLDYVPPADDHDSDTSNEQIKVESTIETTPPKTSPAEQKKQRDALWASFQASVSSSSNGAGQTSSHSPAVKRIKIEKTYLFAGKHVTDVVEVLEDSEEAKKWPRWSPRPCPTLDAVSTLPATPSSEKREVEVDCKGKGDSSAPPSTVAPGPAAPTSTLATKRLGPRKPHTLLPPIPKASQAKKITTLDKSAMDWRAHIASQSSDIKDELDANKRGGGYLEKVEFLKRVEDRREDAFEASKSSKRRKT